MIQAIDIRSELARLPFLHGRGKDTTEAETDAAFTTLSPYRDGGVFGGSFSGESQWERHPQGDEIVYVLDGAARLNLIAENDSEPESLEMTAGMMVVIPRGCWHLFQVPDGVTLVTVTPQPTEHLAADDSRSIALFARLAGRARHELG